MRQRKQQCRQMIYDELSCLCSEGLGYSLAAEYDFLLSCLARQ
jgi:hypothetical protein